MPDLGNINLGGDGVFKMEAGGFAPLIVGAILGFVKTTNVKMAITLSAIHGIHNIFAVGHTVGNFGFTFLLKVTTILFFFLERRIIIFLCRSLAR